MKVLVVGSGGREHALAWRLSRSPRVTSVASCPGNGGLAELGPCWSGIPIEGDFGPLLERIRKEAVDLVVIGPEGPLVDGLADRLRQEGISTFGPGREASRLEGSKAHAKAFMKRHGIPTARFEVVRDEAGLAKALEEFPQGAVVKADGLAAGKGVTVTSTREEAIAAAVPMLSGERFGDAGRTVVVEERLEGVEVTMMVLVSGGDSLPLESAQDYKPLLEGNKGPNTGGMGSYSPTHLLHERVREMIIEGILVPTLAGLEEEGIAYQGVLYLGLMLTPEGPRLLEYNVRFGDPEAQPLLMRLVTDPLDILEAMEMGTLGRMSLEWDPRTALCVALASRGYPGSPATGVAVEGPLLSDSEETVQVFHAGTRRTDGGFLTSGGRVVGVTALGQDLKAARARAYERARQIRFDGVTLRADIGLNPSQR